MVGSWGLDSQALPLACGGTCRIPSGLSFPICDGGNGSSPADSGHYLAGLTVKCCTQEMGGLEDGQQS